MTINKLLPVTATAITTRVAPGHYKIRVGQTVSSKAPAQWQDDNDEPIGSPSRFLLLTPDMAYKTVRAGIGGNRLLVVPQIDVLPKSTDLSPTANRTLAVNRSGSSDFDAGRPFIDWLKNVRIYAEYGATLAVELSGPQTEVVVTAPIPTDIPQTGTLTVGSTSITYISWSGSSFQIAQRTFNTPIAVGSSVSMIVRTGAMKAAGIVDDNHWPLRSPNFSPNIFFLWADVLSDWAGEYFTVTWEGSGTIGNFIGFSLISSGANTIRIRAPSSINSNGANCAFRVTGAATNIRVIPDRFAANYANGETFRPELIELHSSVLQTRFMDWNRTNGSAATSWAARVLPSLANYSPIPYEVQLEFAIAAGQSEIYFTLPHLADNDYITNFAIWLRNNMPVGMTPYVELSNEVWNFLPGFTQTGYFDNLELSNWGVSKYRSAYGRRMAEMFHLISLEYTGAIVRVCGTQTISPTVTTDAFVAPAWRDNDNYYSASLGITLLAPHNYVDAIGITNYFDSYMTQSVFLENMRAAYAVSEDTGHQFIFASLMEQGRGLQEADAAIKSQRVIANSYNKKLIGYEGGNHMVYAANPSAPREDEFQDQNLDLIFSFARSDYYAEIYYHLWRMWEQRTDGPFMQYYDVGRWSRFGMWTMRENFGHEMYPVHQVLNWLSRNRPKWWT